MTLRDRPGIRLTVAPKAPPTLTPRARFEWGRLVPRAVRAGLVHDVDLAAYGLACEALAEVRRLGSLIEAETAAKVFNPRTRRAFVAATNAARRALADLHLTPKSRQGRMTVEIAPPPKKESVFAALRRGERPLPTDEEGASK